MALPTNTVTQYETVGDREDLQDIIYNIAPTETPFMNNAGRTTAKAVLHEWQTDTLEDIAANRKLEGDDAVAKTFVATTRLSNYCQISEKTVIVSGTARAIDQAGRADELAYQVAKRGKELKRDMERALVQNQASSAGGASTARSSASVESWLSTNKTSQGASAAGATTPGFSGGVVVAPTDASSVGTFTKANLDAVIKQCYEEGGEPTVIMVNPHNRTIVSGFTGISTLETRADQGMDISLIGAVDFYKSNFGILSVQPNRFMRGAKWGDTSAQALILDMEYWSVAFLRPMRLDELAKTGDAEKRQMLTEFTLVSENEAASGKITDLTVS